MTEMPNMPVPELLFIIDSDVFCVCVRAAAGQEQGSVLVGEDLAGHSLGVLAARLRLAVVPKTSPKAAEGDG